MKFTVHMMDPIEPTHTTLCGLVWNGLPEIHETDLIKMCDVCTEKSGPQKPPEGPTDEQILFSVASFWQEMGTPEGWLEAPYPTDDPNLRCHFTEEEIENKMYEMADRGILEYGISIRTSWIVNADYEAPHGLTPSTMRIISKVIGDKR